MISKLVRRNIAATKGRLLLMLTIERRDPLRIRRRVVRQRFFPAGRQFAGNL